MDAPLGFPHEVTTAAAAQAAGLIGPFPFHVITEILLRVKTLEYRSDYWDGVNFNSVTLEMRRWLMFHTSLPLSDIPDEDDATRYFIDQADYGYSPGTWNEEWPHNDEYDGMTSDGIVFTTEEYTTTNDPIFYGQSIKLGWTYGETPPPVTLKDENGKWWIRLYHSAPYQGFGGTNTHLNTITGQLILSSGTYPFPVWSDSQIIPSTSLTGDEVFTITATEWYPYATSAGLPAWDTTTGLPINGGPGA